MRRLGRVLRLGAVSLACATLISSCGFSVFSLPLPGGADTGENPYKVKIAFRDVLDLVPQSAVKVDDLTVGKVTDIGLRGWTAEVTIELNRDVELPDNAEAKIRQTSLLGEKFVSLSSPDTGATGKLSDGDRIPLARSGRNPEVEEVLGALSLLLNGGGLAKVSTITEEVNKALGGREPEIRDLLDNAGSLMTRLDANKAQIVTALRQVNRLAKETDKQKKAITGALDELPGAVRVLNNQRDDIVKLLESLNRLSDIGTETINKSKANTIRDLKMLKPIVRNLADAGDSLPQSLGLLLTYPFPDTLVGRTPAEARDAHIGDYSNLSVRLELKTSQVQNLLGALAGEGPSLPTSSPKLNTKALDGLEGLLKGNDSSGARKQPTEKNDTKRNSGTPEVPELPGTETRDSGGAVPKLDPCSLLSLLCRPAPGGSPATSASPELDPEALDQDAATLLIAPVVAQ